MNQDKDIFGTRMKEYEVIEAGRKFIPLLPVCARLDGKSFHTYTKKFTRPYDMRFNRLMIDTTKFLVNETNACMGYSQSDEISLVYYSDDYNSQIFFDGKIQKMNSILTSMTTAFFNGQSQSRLRDPLVPYLPMAYFDCRVWQVPTLTEAANVFLWREQDATKNSISMAASHYYSHKQLDKKSGKEKQEMLFQKGVNWNDYPNFFKRGTFIQRHDVTRKFTIEEINKLPAKHEARTNPDLQIKRNEIRELDMPKFSSVSNRVSVIFEGQEPIPYPSPT